MEHMHITYETVKQSEEIRTYITQADASLLALGYTEHSFAAGAGLRRPHGGAVPDRRLYA